MTKLGHQEQLEMAWEIQGNGDVKLLWQDVDVECECLAKLEEELFERSEVAGIAGEYQWGLDAGDHQDAWNPYNGLPDHWIHTNRLENYDNDEKVSDTLNLKCINCDKISPVATWPKFRQDYKNNKTDC